MWKDAIDKEMTDSRGAFDVLEDIERTPGGFKCIGCHMIFEVKADLRHKERYVAQGFRSNPPTLMTLSPLRAAIRSREKVYFIAGKEWCPLQGI